MLDTAFQNFCHHLTSLNLSQRLEKSAFKSQTMTDESSLRRKSKLQYVIDELQKMQPKARRPRQQTRTTMSLEL